MNTDAINKAINDELVWVLDQLNMKGLLTVTSAEALEALGDTPKPPQQKAQPVPPKALKAPKQGSRTKPPAVLLPFCGVVVDDWCCGTRLNHGLYTQCTMAKVPGTDFCKTCGKQADKNESGLPNYGSIEARLAPDWTPPAGKAKLARYPVVAAKTGINLATAQEEAERLGWTIPEGELGGKRGKTADRRDPHTSDTEDDEPKAKPEKVVLTEQESEQIVAQLVKEADADAADPAPPKTKAADKKREKEELKAMRAAERESKKVETAARKQREKEEKQRAKVQAKLDKEEAEKKAKEEKLSEQAAKRDADAAAAEKEEEIETLVEKWTHPETGKVYKRDSDNNVYDYESDEIVGHWVEETQELSTEWEE